LNPTDPTHECPTCPLGICPLALIFLITKRLECSRSPSPSKRTILALLLLLMHRCPLTIFELLFVCGRSTNGWFNADHCHSSSPREAAQQGWQISGNTIAQLGSSGKPITTSVFTFGSQAFVELRLIESRRRHLPRGNEQSGRVPPCGTPHCICSHVWHQR
jgi:hypothetical protein